MYQDGGGYDFFTGKDGSAAFVTGKFDEAGLVADVRSLKANEVLSVWEWADFYRKHETYRFVGYLDALYYNAKGERTAAWRAMHRLVVAARKERDADDEQKKEWPGCNMRSSGTERVFWCEDGSGGIKRGWAGLPRRFISAGKEERCVCAPLDRLTHAQVLYHVIVYIHFSLSLSLMFENHNHSLVFMTIVIRTLQAANFHRILEFDCFCREKKINQRRRRER